jgi:hypothetical protein
MEKLKHKVRSDVFESLIDGKNIFEIPQQYIYNLWMYL